MNVFSTCIKSCPNCNLDAFPSPSHVSSPSPLLFSSLPEWLQSCSCYPRSSEQNSTLRRELKQFISWVRKNAAGCSSMSIKLYDQWRVWRQKSQKTRSQVGKHNLSVIELAAGQFCRIPHRVCLGLRSYFHTKNQRNRSLL